MKVVTGGLKVVKVLAVGSFDCDDWLGTMPFTQSKTHRKLARNRRAAKKMDALCEYRHRVLLSIAMAGRKSTRRTDDGVSGLESASRRNAMTAHLLIMNPLPRARR